MSKRKLQISTTLERKRPAISPSTLFAGHDLLLKQQVYQDPNRIQHNKMRMPSIALPSGSSLAQDSSMHTITSTDSRSTASPELSQKQDPIQENHSTVHELRCSNMTVHSLPSPAPSQDRSCESIIDDKSSLPASLVDSFPDFCAGDVAISTKLTGPVMHWQLHSSVLTRNSNWFAHSVEEQHLKANERSRFSYVYLIEAIDGRICLIQQTSGERRNETTPRDRCGGVSLEVHAGGEAEAIIQIYDQIFGAFYNIAPELPTTDIDAATSHAEKTIRLAQHLECTHLVSPHIGNSLLQYRQTLFKAILADPPRYLLLAIALKNDFIYTESLIHLIGAYPCWPWPTKQDTLPEGMRRLIARKAQKLDGEVLEAERRLLLLTITRARDREPFRCDVSAQFDTWFNVQFFRNTLADELRRQDESSRAPMKRGTLLRRIKAGGSSYMAYEGVRSIVMKVMPSAVDVLEEDMGLLKMYASRVMQDLTKNELSLDVEENRVGWLTCAKIESVDIPWRAEADNGV